MPPEETPPATPPPAAPPAGTPDVVPYSRFQEVVAGRNQLKDDYKATQAELTQAREKLESFSGWMSPDDHAAAVQAEIGKVQRDGNLSTLLAGAGITPGSRQARFIRGEFEGVERGDDGKGWDAHLETLRAESPEFFPGPGGARRPPSTNPEAGIRTPGSEGGGSLQRGAFSQAVADGSYFDPEKRKALLGSAGFKVS